MTRSRRRRKYRVHNNRAMGAEPGIMDTSEAGKIHAVVGNFNVFLNHRGPDVKSKFVAHLEEALTCAGFLPFLDVRSLIKGNPALKRIGQALDMAKVHVAVVSRGYAESKYCLNELVAMLRSGKPVIPVFYDVEPVDLRWVENGPFAEAFEKHRVNRTKNKVQEWREALGKLAEITGFRLADYHRDEAQLKQEVVKAVARLTPSNEPVEVERYRVGLEGPANRCIQMLESMGNGIGVLGLVGMPGVGKTTLAKEIYNHFAARMTFRCMTFLEIHRDSSNSNVEVRPTWSKQLRKQLLWDLLRVEDTSNYSSWFEKVSTLGPVLIVIDNVDKLDQFEALILFTSLLHPSSRIIVTSRDRSILTSIAERTNYNHYLFDVSTLGPDESNLLFNWYAFQAKEAPEGFKDLANDIVKTCDGLPLALKVIGSSLFDKRSDEDKKTIWPEAKDALRQNMDVMGVLRWCYDNLPDLEKLMFLDITCLFYDRKAEEALAYWKSCKYCISCGGVKTPHTSLRNLIDKNIINRNWTGLLEVHDLFRDLGQEIGRKTKRHFVENRIAEAIVANNQGTEQTMALNLNESQRLEFEVRNFTSMTNLHYVIFPDGCNLNGDLKGISKELRWLQWRNIPFAYIPMDLNLFNLISLDLSESSNLASLWIESNISLEGCPNLFRLNLSKCTSITKLPDSIQRSSQLQDLNLGSCKKLKKLPESIGQLKALKHLNISYCTSLKALPDTIGALSNLKFFYAHSCTSLVKLPPSTCHLSSLYSLSVEAGAKCEILLDGVIGEAWAHLHHLKVVNCGALGSFLNYGALKCLEMLELCDSILTELPESIGLLGHLEFLEIYCERLQCLPKSIGDLKTLKTLYVINCKNLKKLPKTLGLLSNLEDLNIWECPGIRRLPWSIGRLSRLQKLELCTCENLQRLPNSIRQLRNLQVFLLEDCGSIEGLGVLTTLQGLPIWGTTSLTHLPASLGMISALVAYKGNPTPNIIYFRCLVGTNQLLQEDDSGFLIACQYKYISSGIVLIRGPQHKVRIQIISPSTTKCCIVH